MASREEEDDDLFEEGDRLTRRQVAVLLGIDPRTVLTMVEDGSLKRDAEGNYSKTQVQGLIAQSSGHQQNEALRLANEHIETIIKLMAKPLEVATNTLIQSNQQLTDRLKAQDAAHLEMMVTMGDLLMQKEEREAMKRMSEAKAKTLEAAGAQVSQMLPHLLSQFFAKGGKSEKGALKSFFLSLDAEERAAIIALGDSFEGEKKTLFEAMVRGLDL